MGRKRRSPPREGTYEVGYGKPPVHTRFKPGESGNKKGRPKGHPNLATAFDDELNAKVIINEGGRRRTVTKRRVVVLQTVANAMKGDPRALAAILQVSKCFGKEEEPPKEGLREELEAHDRAILDDFIARNRLTTPTEIATPSTPDDPEPEGDD